MKRAPSATPVSVRFLNSGSAECDGDGDDGQDEARPAPEEAAGDACPDPAPTPPVPPPRKQSVRSRADEWRDALQDLSPVKELVSRLGKSRSSSFDHTAGMSPPPEKDKEKTTEAPETRRTTEVDAWSRLSELRGKITKTVEDKISDYRAGSGRASVTSADNEQLLSEADVLESVRDSPPPSPTQPVRTASPQNDDLDVTFVNVPNPIAAPAEPPEQPPSPPPTTASVPSPSRREFRLASIRPKIYERLQRHVNRPAASPPPPPAAAPAAVVPNDSVTLSALQGKYIDEEAVEAAEEAMEEPMLNQLSLEPAERFHSARASSPRQAAQPEAAAALERSPDRDGATWWSRLTGSSARLLVVLLAVVFAAPLPPFVSGLVLGVGLTAMVSVELMDLVRPPRRHRPVTSLNDVHMPVHEEQPTLMHKGWMHELSTGPYDPEAHLATEARFVRLEGSMLRLSHPKGHVSRRAQCDEVIPNLPFVEQRIYDIAGCSVSLLPAGLHHTRWWSRRYPVCVSLEHCQRVTRSMGLSASVAAGLGGARQHASRGSERTSSSDGEWGSEEEVRLDGAAPSDAESALYLFARTDRGKEEWYRLLRQATGAAERAAPPEDATSADGGATTVVGPEEASGPPSAINVEPSPRLDFDYYMSKLIPSHTEEPAQARAAAPGDVHTSPRHGAAPHSYPPAAAGHGSDPAIFSRHLEPAAHHSESHVMWFNALIGRVAFDVFGNKKWAEFVQNRVQRKINKLKLPYFLEELLVTSCDLGSVVPRILSVSRPHSDERGLWADTALLYEGGACITLRTKVNLMKLGKEREMVTEDRTPTVSDACLDEIDQCLAAYQFDRRDDVSDDSSSDEDEPERVSQAAYALSVVPDSGGAGTPALAAQSSAPSVGKRLLQVVDRVTTSRYFQQAAQNRYVKRYMEEFSNTPLELTVTLKHLRGVLTVNIPRPPTDRLWYGFRGIPDVVLSAQPRLGSRDVTFTHVTDWIENKLVAEMHKMLVLPNMEDLIIPLMEPEPESTS